MSWTWAGYDLDAVHRFKDESFFQTGRNSAEARFWKLKIHETDRRGTKSSIEFDKNDEVTKESSDTKDNAANEDEEVDKHNDDISSSKDYQYSYTPLLPNDTSKNNPNTNSPTAKDTSKDYQYTYPNPRDRSMSIVSTISRVGYFPPSKDYQYSYPEQEEEEKEEEEKDDHNEDVKKEKVADCTKKTDNITSIKANYLPPSQVHVSSRFY